MSSSVNKGVRKQSAEARRGRAVKKRVAKSAVRSHAVGSLAGFRFRVRVPAQIPEEALTLARVV
jgi:hypothetical protein